MHSIRYLWAWFRGLGEPGVNGGRIEKSGGTICVLLMAMRQQAVEREERYLINIELKFDINIIIRAKFLRDVKKASLRDRHRSQPV